jgi:hypothetical protein
MFRAILSIAILHWPFGHPQSGCQNNDYSCRNGTLCTQHSYGNCRAKENGNFGIRIVFVRTLSSLFLGWMLNIMLPGQSTGHVTEYIEAAKLPFLNPGNWLVDTLKIAIPMVLLVFSLTIFQRLLSEFGVIRYIAKFLRPVMKFFGLPPKTAFLWIVANILGLAYGAAVMIDEAREGKVSRRDIDLLNHHISISHSNLEDLILFSTVGGLMPWMLFSRWIMSFFLVWERRLERFFAEKVKGVRSEK